MENVSLFDGIKIHFTNDNRFKTNFIAINLITALNRSTITKNVLIPLVLRRGTNNYPTMKELSEKLENMYGAVLDSSSNKIGDNLVIQFCIDCINDDYTLEESNLMLDSIDLLNDIILNPVLEYGHFKEEYVSQEKETLRELINSKINDKSSYSVDRATEELFKDDPYGVYKFGYVEDLDDINSQNLYEQYLELIKSSEINIYVSGKFDEEKVIDSFKKSYDGIKRVFNSSNTNRVSKDIYINQNLQDSVSEISEKQDVIQGKFVLGYKLKNTNLVDDYYKMLVYSAILGGTASSKLFMNVREKMSLAYTIRSTYLKHKGALLVSAGIEIDKYQVAIDATKKEIEDIRQGVITAEELESAKVNLITSFKSVNDSLIAMVGLEVGQDLLNSDTNVNDIIDKVNQVTINDVVEVANRLSLQVEYFLN